MDFFHVDDVEAIEEKKTRVPIQSEWDGSKVKFVSGPKTFLQEMFRLFGVHWYLFVITLFPKFLLVGLMLRGIKLTPVTD